jgi:hypothetical protein
MSYLHQLQSAASGGMGSPPTPGPRHIGAAPPGPQHTEPPPYDVAHDPAWKGILDPNNAPLRSFLNEISPEQRQMLLQEVMKMKAAPMLNQAQMMPTQPPVGPPGAGAAPVFPPQ